jgi:predicted XRE-type DNA-binding protein
MKGKATRSRKLLDGEHGTIEGTDFLIGSDNVFRDLGFADADERKAKAKLALQINMIIEEKGWTQTVAAEKLRTRQPEISSLRRGQLKSITYDRLLGWLNSLGYSVEIRIAKARKPRLEVAIAV